MLIFDTDFGYDDVVALIVAKELKLDAITLVNGVQSLSKTISNAKKTLNYLKMNTKLYHSYTSYNNIRAKNTKFQPYFCGNDIYHSNYFDKLHLDNATIIACGPLTNVAKFIEDKNNVRKILFSGTTFGDGNINEYCEYNVFADSISAKKVFDSNINIYVFPIDLTKHIEYNLNETSHDKFLNYIGRFSLYDIAPIIYLINNDAFKFINYKIDVVNGQTIINYSNISNTFIAYEYNIKIINEILNNILKK